MVWLLLLNFCFSLFPTVGFAQRVSATIRSLRGNVIVSGGKARVGRVLYSGDSISTWAGASALLRLSDGSEIQIGENTRINIDDLRQTSAGGRASALTMLVGWLRATLSPGHQGADSSFTVNTPNAQIGTRFSVPKFDVYVSPDQEETWAMAHTVELVVTNRLTGEVVVVPVGSSAIIKGAIVQVFPRILDPVGGTEGGGDPPSNPPDSGTGGGLSTGTKVLIGAGALAVAGGVAAVILINNNEDDSSSNDESEATGQCEGLQTSGSDTSETHTIDLGEYSGTFLFEYQIYDIEESESAGYAGLAQMIVEYEGSVLFDSGCVNTGDWQTQSISYSGESSEVTVRVIPNCYETYGAFWEFVVNCP